MRIPGGEGGDAPARSPPGLASDISTKPAIKAASGGDSCSHSRHLAQRDGCLAPRLVSPRHTGVLSRGQETSELSHCGQKVLGMKLGVTCLLWLLLLCLTLPTTHGHVLERSMEIRSKENTNPDIDPSWYTGRGIRPVGRFGRRQALGGDSHPGGAGRQRGCAAPHPHPHPPRLEMNP